MGDIREFLKAMKDFLDLMESEEPMEDEYELQDRE